MNSTAKCLKESTDTALERLEYLNRRIQQRKSLDIEIENLHGLLKRDFQYISSLLNSMEIPPVSVPEASDVPVVKNEIQPEPAAKSLPKPNKINASRPVLQLDKNGKVIQRFESVRTAERVTWNSATQISIAARNKRSTRDGSFWRYEDDETPMDFDRPVIVESCDGKIKERYASPFEAANALGVPSRRVQIILRSKSHKDEKVQFYYWFEDEYDAAHGVA